MKTLIVGRNGQLALALQRHAPSHAEVIALGRGALDLAVNLIEFDAQLAKHRPQVVINAAAYTAVDQAESERSAAFAVNDDAVGAMASACVVHSARFVHLSTDFVFDGRSGRPYLPSDVTGPLNVYGASKLAGERRIQSVQNLDWRIVRTAWVYSGDGRGFLLTMLRLFAERDEVRVVADQVGTPTSAVSLADCVWRAASDTGGAALLHFTDAGVASWYDFAIAIYEEAQDLGLVSRSVRIVPIASSQYPTAARRPGYSVLDKSETLARLAIAPVHWRVKLREVLQGLKS